MANLDPGGPPLSPFTFTLKIGPLIDDRVHSVMWSEEDWDQDPVLTGSRRPVHGLRRRKTTNRKFGVVRFSDGHVKASDQINQTVSVVL
ncbi:uncharacterized protein V6R79_000091 [Siganus canaliculatus]